MPYFHGWVEDRNENMVEQPVLRTLEPSAGEGGAEADLNPDLLVRSRKEGDGDGFSCRRMVEGSVLVGIRKA
jgi:hypothetical protein